MVVFYHKVKNVKNFVENYKREEGRLLLLFYSILQGEFMSTTFNMRMSPCRHMTLSYMTCSSSGSSARR